MDAFLEQRRHNLLEVQRAELEALERKIATEKDAARKVVSAQGHNFADSLSPVQRDGAEELSAEQNARACRAAAQA